MGTKNLARIIHVFPTASSAGTKAERSPLEYSENAVYELIHYRITAAFPTA